jgi:DNA-binding NarL/FixJ family response regulator
MKTKYDFPGTAITVLLADSRQMERQLLAAALERCGFEVLVCENDPAAVLEIAEQRSPQVVVMGDDQESAETRMSSLRTLHLVHPEIPKLFLMDSDDRETAVQAFRCGACGLFSLADSSFQSLCECIQQAFRGEICATARQLNFLLEAVRRTSPFQLVNNMGENLLTAREGQVVALVSDGLSNRDVASELGLSEHTVKKYLFRIFDKLGISSRVELVLYALHNGALARPAWPIPPPAEASRPGVASA